MFSTRQKREIAAVVEKVLLSFDHPEMPKDKPNFKLHVDDKEDWSWADIQPNWVFDDGHAVATQNPWNESNSIRVFDNPEPGEEA